MFFDYSNFLSKVINWSNCISRPCIKVPRFLTAYWTWSNRVLRAIRSRFCWRLLKPGVTWSITFQPIPTGLVQVRMFQFLWFPIQLTSLSTLRLVEFVGFLSNFLASICSALSLWIFVVFTVQYLQMWRFRIVWKGDSIWSWKFCARLSARRQRLPSKNCRFGGIWFALWRKSWSLALTW